MNESTDGCVDGRPKGRVQAAGRQAEWVQGQHMFVRRPSASRRMTRRDMSKQTLVPFHAFSSAACSSLRLRRERSERASHLLPRRGCDVRSERVCSEPHAARCMHARQKRRISGGAAASFLAGRSEGRDCR
jgi:hypothetical protein